MMDLVWVGWVGEREREARAVDDDDDDVDVDVDVDDDDAGAREKSLRGYLCSEPPGDATPSTAGSHVVVWLDPSWRGRPPTKPNYN